MGNRTAYKDQGLVFAKETAARVASAWAIPCKLYPRVAERSEGSREQDGFAATLLSNDGPVRSLRDGLRGSLSRPAEANGYSVVFFAAFELRCALERTPFDFYLLVSERDPGEAIEKSKAYLPKDLFALAEQEEPELEKKIQFSSLLLRFHGQASGNEPFDLAWIKSYHGRCGQYLHLVKDPKTTVWSDEWLAAFRAFVEETNAKLLAMWRTNRGVLPERKWTEKGRAMWELFKSGSDTDEQIIGMFRLSDF